jgi:molybdopterin converting factor small subunit
MNTIKIEAYSWISGSLGQADNQNLALDKELKEGLTLLDLFKSLAGQYPVFGQKVFNLQTGQIDDQVMIIVNGRLIQFKDFKSTVMHDQDSITLSPMLVGG